MRFIIYGVGLGALLSAFGISITQEPLKFFAYDIPLLLIGFAIIGRN